MYDDESKYFGDYGPLDGSVSENGAARGGSGGVGVNAGGGGCGGSDAEASDDGPGVCTSKPTKCSVPSMGRGDAKLTATGFAQKAAQEAKAANDAQVPAAEAASFQAKCELAGKAIESAKGAEAVLAGKQELLEQARIELNDAEKEALRLSSSMRSMQDNADLANNAVQDIQAVLGHVKNVLHEAAKNVASLQCVAKGALQELTEKNQILKAAKFRAGNLGRQLAEAKADFDKTKMAAYKAVCAAVEAKQKAQRARRMSWMYLDDLVDFL
ncbi:glycine, alanine and asparagine-rich protein-like [Drosophila serrata]|uniref:glycine, alanine and asparagine-rich protein-like n=1 Tax=Drosophila serrata TaxID=7274 RepID=UPI000A1D1324|nr:glycine, alanine and asparagine-rich protein-like [Drosophila serrata]